MSWYFVKRVFATPVASICGAVSTEGFPYQCRDRGEVAYTSDQQRDDCFTCHDCELLLVGVWEETRREPSGCFKVVVEGGPAVGADDGKRKKRRKVALSGELRGRCYRF